MCPAFEKWVIYGLNSLIQNCIIIQNKSKPQTKKTQKPPPTHAPKNPPQNCTSLLSVKKKKCFRSLKKKSALEVLVLAWFLWKCRARHPNQEE